jgi:diguanylate cyclase (GGDEF)-like protein/PAS domain S-box-containing protein
MRDRALITIRWLVGPAGRPALIAALAVLLDAVWLIGGWGGEDLIIYGNDRLAAALNFAAAWACISAARSPNTPVRLRPVWLLFGLGQIAIGIGNTLWIIDQRSYIVSPEAALVDLLYLAGYLLNIAALLILASAHKLIRSRAFWLDILTVAVGGSIVLWYLVVRPLAASQLPAPIDLVTTLSYPVLDTLFITMLLTLWRRDQEIDPRVFLLLTLTVIATAIGNIFFAIDSLLQSYTATSLYNVIWLAGFVLLIAAARLQSYPCDAPPTPAIRATVAAGARVAPWALIGVAFIILLAVAISTLGSPLSEALLTSIALCLVVVLRQLLALREQGRALAAAQHEAVARYQLLVSRLPGIVYEQEAQPPYAITFVSPLAEVIFGRPTSQLLGPTKQAWCTYVHPEDIATIDAIDAETNQTGAPFSAEYRVIRPDGSVVWVREEAQLVSHEGGAHRSWQGIVIDISDHRTLQEQLIHRVNHDPLTGIYNREFFYQQLQRLCGSAQPFALCFIDLDQFKLVNDTYGHAVGDQLLSALAQRLRDSMRPGDTVARLAGDEFVALIVGPAALEPDPIVTRLIGAVSEPYAIDGATILVTPSIGVAVSSPPHEAPAPLLDRADRAMYEAKGRGAGQYAISIGDLEPTPAAE